MERANRNEYRGRDLTPSIGQFVELVGGTVGHVLSVRRPSDILSNMSEPDAVVFVSAKRSAYGCLWAERFYEIDVSVDGKTKKVEANGVARVLQRWL